MNSIDLFIKLLLIRLRMQKKVMPSCAFLEQHLYKGTNLLGEMEIDLKYNAMIIQSHWQLLYKEIKCIESLKIPVHV